MASIFEGLPHGQVFEKPAGLQNGPNIAALHRLFRGDTLHGEVPRAGSVSPRIISMRVVLPAPFGPSRAMISPLLMVRSRLSNGSEGAAWNPENLGQILCLE